MAIYRMLQGMAFDDRSVRVMTTAYESVLAELGLNDRHDPLTEIIARKILELCRTGERDPERLCVLTLEEIRS